MWYVEIYFINLSSKKQHLSHCLKLVSAKCLFGLFQYCYKAYKFVNTIMKANEEWSSQLWTPRICAYLRSLKKIQDFNGFWTLDLAIPVRRSSSNQLSYEATDVFSGQVCVHVFPCLSLSREHMNTYFTSSQHQWLQSIAPVSRGHGFKSSWSPGFFFQASYALA